MNILLLGDAGSAHMIRWQSALRSLGPTVDTYSMPTQVPGRLAKSRSLTEVSKLLACFTHIQRLRRIVSARRPDVINAHYLTSYGLLGAAAGVTPVVCSAWGSDVLAFPNVSRIHETYVRAVARRASALTASSGYLAEALAALSGRTVSIVPFGIDVTEPARCGTTRAFADDATIIGTVKTFEETYGISTLVDAFIELKRRKGSGRLKLVVVGDGSLRQSMWKRVCDAGLAAECVFPGKVPLHQVISWHKGIDIFVAPSVRESFGVSLIEAMACSRPCIVANIPAFIEVGGNSVYKFNVGSATSLAAKIIDLVSDDRTLRHLGEQARLRATRFFDIRENAKTMLEVLGSAIRLDREAARVV